MHGEFKQEEVLGWIERNLSKVEVTTLEPVMHTRIDRVIAVRFELSSKDYFARLLIGIDSNYPTVLIYDASMVAERPIKMEHGKAGVQDALRKYFGSA